MSPRAACRLETLGFERVYRYVLGKADWLARGLPREGEKTSVINERRVLLGRVRRSMLGEDNARTTVEEMMESGPSTVRPSEVAAALVVRLATRGLHTAILTTPEGVLFGVLHRADTERRVAHPDR